MPANAHRIFCKYLPTSMTVFPVLLLLLLSVLLMSLSLGLLFDLRLNLTPSMPVGIYRMAASVEADFSRGDFVSIQLAGPFAALALERGYLCGSECLVKTLVGLPGDRVDVGKDGIRVNGMLLPESRIRTMDSHHRPMPASQLSSGQIPTGMALVMSHAHPGGFDGRYFGLVPLTSMRKVHLVWAAGGGA